ncbi:MAG: aldo/keto reductase [Candidatus Hodarchaeales archaeon]
MLHQPKLLWLGFLINQWLLNKPVITSPIVGFSKVEYVESAIEALEIKLSSDDIKHMEEPYQPHPAMGN